jgi:WD40 repeat protein
MGTAIAHFSLQNRAKDIYWLPNSPFLAATSVDNRIYVWDTFGSGKDIAYRHREGKWSPDARYMAYPVTDGVEVYDVVQQCPVCTYRGQTEITALTWSPDGRRIASAGKAAGEQSIHIWYAFNGHLERETPRHKGPRRKISLLTWSSDGRYLACTDDSATVTIWSANDLIISCTLSPDLAVVQEIPTELHWSATGRYLAIGLPGQVRVWNVLKTIDASYQWASQGLGQPGAKAAPQMQNASKDVRDYLTYGQDQPLLLWCPFNADFQQNPNRRTENSFLALLNDSNSIVVWDVAMGGQVSHCTSDTSIHSLTWSPDGKALVAGGEQGLIEIWDPWTGKKLQQVRHGELQPDYEVHALAWSPTGHYLASGGGTLSGGDHHILLWQEYGLTHSVSLDLPSQSSLLKFIKRLDVSSWLAFLLCLLDLAVPFLIGIITTSLLAFFVAPFFALVAVALAAKSVIDLRHTTRSADDTLAFSGILALFTVVWGIAFFAVGDSASGGATGGFILGAVGAVFVGWFFHRLFLKALYRGASYSDVNNPKTWGGEWGSRG